MSSSTEVIQSKSGLVTISDIERFLLERCLVYTEVIHERKKSLIRTLHQELFERFLTFMGLSHRAIKPIEFQRLLQGIIKKHQLPVLYCRAIKGMCWEGLILRERAEEAQQALDISNRTKNSSVKSKKKRKCLEARVRFLIDNGIMERSIITRDDFYEIRRSNLKKIVWRVDNIDLPWNLPEPEMLLEFLKDTHTLIMLYVDIDRTAAETALRWNHHKEIKKYMDEAELALYTAKQLSAKNSISSEKVDRYLKEIADGKFNIEKRQLENKKLLFQQVVKCMNVDINNTKLVSRIKRIFDISRDGWVEIVATLSPEILEDEAKTIAEFISEKIQIQDSVVRNPPMRILCKENPVPVRPVRREISRELVVPLPVIKLKLKKVVQTKANIKIPQRSIMPVVIHGREERWTEENELELQDMFRDKESGEWDDLCQNELNIMVETKHRLHET